MRWGTIGALAVLLVLAITPEAHAWGPAVHVGIADAVLGQLALLPASIGAMLLRHRYSYLYGNIAADVVFAKRLSRVRQFCHQWSTGFKLLEAAPDESGRAFAWGYLSHLAADTVAHGKYVPRQMVMSECRMNFGHFYWELRADATVAEPTWRDLRDVLVADHDRHHVLMKPFMSPALLRYDVNRVLFQGMNHVCTRQPFRHTVDLCGRLSRFGLASELIHSYRDECADRVISVLTEGANSAVLKDDPNGSAALLEVSTQRREQRTVARRTRTADRQSRRSARTGTSGSPTVREA